jgi:ABC-type uncharacterized transport system substrate-binding protein
MVFDNAAGKPASDYTDQLTDALKKHTPTRTVKVWTDQFNDPPATIGEDVVIVARDASRDITKYKDIAAHLFSLSMAVAVVVADSIAIHKARAARSADADNAKKVVLSGVFADPYAFGNVLDDFCAGVVLTNEGLNYNRLRFLKKLAPDISTVSIIRVKDTPSGDNPDKVNYCADKEEKELRAAALDPAIQLTLPAKVIEMKAKRDGLDSKPIDNAKGMDALIVIRDPAFQYQSDALIAACQGKNVPVMYPYPSFAEAGGLIAHGPDLKANTFRVGDQVATLLDRLDANSALTELPCGDLGFSGPQKIETVINQAEFNRLRPLLAGTTPIQLIPGVRLV